MTGAAATAAIGPGAIPGPSSPVPLKASLLNSAAYDFGWAWADYARLLPAWQLYGIDFPVAPLRGPPLPAGLVPSDLDPFSPGTRLSRHSHGLISAGVVAQGNPSLLARPMNNIIGSRPKAACYVLGDSGGFQIITMNLPVTNRWRAHQLAWSELHCDAAVPLDVPTAAVYAKGNDYFCKFALALQHSVESHDFWERNYKGAPAEQTGRKMRRLIVLQGHTPQQARAWYDALVKRKGYRWEGAAVGGNRRKHLGHLALTALNMKADGVLDTLEHLHILGFAEIGYAVCLTALKRAIEEEIGRPILLTYDVSTPFQYGYIFQQAILGLDWGGRLTLKSKALGQPTTAWDGWARAPLPGSELGRLGLTMADLRRRGHPNYQGWDEAGRIMVCHHNVDAMCNAIVLANQIADAEDGGGTIDITSIRAGLIPTPVKQARCVLRNIFKFSNPENEVRFWSKPLGTFAGDDGEDDR